MSDANSNFSRDMNLAKIADIFAAMDVERPDFELDTLRMLLTDLVARFQAFTADESAFVHQGKDGRKVKDPTGYQIYFNLAKGLNDTLINIRKVQADAVRITESIGAALRMFGQQTIAGVLEDLRTWQEIIRRLDAVLAGPMTDAQKVAHTRETLRSLRTKMDAAVIDWRNLLVSAYDLAIERALSNLPT